MKKTTIKIIFYSLFFIPSIKSVHAQEYHYVPFPTSNAVWSENFTQGESGQYNKYALFDEDTVINDKLYHKLYHCSLAEITKENSICIGGIREDSSKQVWFKCINNSAQYMFFVNNTECSSANEIKLFDFGGEAGDTILGINESLGCRINAIQNIDTLKINNTYRKVFSFSPPISKWIDGIGSTTGLLFPSGFHSGSHNNNLICMHHNDTLLYKSPRYNDCVPKFVHNNTVLLPNTDIKVYPNPVNGEEVYFENLDFETLELFDGKGCLLESKDICGENNYILKLTNYPKGIYFYHLETKGLIPTHGKLIIE